VATSPEAVRAQLAIVTTAVSVEVANAANGAPLERRADAALAATQLIVPGYYDAAGSLAVAWYDERRDTSSPSTVYAPSIVGDPETDWIERETAAFARTLAGDLEAEMARMVDEVTRLAAKEAARGFRDSILGNTRMDEDAIGWSRVARAGACKFCVMVASRGAVYRQDTATFAAHKNCHCTAQPEFRNGTHGPEASVEQYLAAQSTRTPAQRNALRKYLNTNYPDNHG
jgi:hypothetical protein